MVTIKRRNQFRNAFAQGLVYLCKSRQSSKDEVLAFLERRLGRARKTIEHWAYARQEQVLDDEVLYGYAWLVVYATQAPLTWLVELMSATTAIVVQPPTAGWVRACFEHALVVAPDPRFEEVVAYGPDPERVEQLIERFFSQPSAVPSAAVDAPPAAPRVPPMLPDWVRQAQAVLRQLDSDSDRAVPQPLMERYWEAMPRPDMPMALIQREYHTLRNYLAYTRQHELVHEQLDATLLLMHYMYVRWLIDDRLTYVNSALHMVERLPNAYDRKWIEAMLHIDGLALIHIETSRFQTAQDHLESGLKIAEALGPEPTTGYQDLLVMGYTRKAELVLRTNPSGTAEAWKYLTEVHDLPCRPFVSLARQIMMMQVGAQRQGAKSVHDLYYEAAWMPAFAQFLPSLLISIRSAAALLRVGNVVAAEVLVHKVQEKNPGGCISLPWFVEAQLLMAQIKIANQQHDQACRIMRELFVALEREPKLPPRHYLVAEARALYDLVIGYCTED